MEVLDGSFEFVGSQVGRQSTECSKHVSRTFIWHCCDFISYTDKLVVHLVEAKTAADHLRIHHCSQKVLMTDVEGSYPIVS